jgi:hypothetical protein
MQQGSFIVTLSASEGSPPGALREMLRFAQHDSSSKRYDIEEPLDHVDPTLVLV